jgi:hypothetical protein
MEVTEAREIAEQGDLLTEHRITFAEQPGICKHTLFGPFILNTTLHASI